MIQGCCPAWQSYPKVACGNPRIVKLENNFKKQMFKIDFENCFKNSYQIQPNFPCLLNYSCSVTGRTRITQQ